MLDDIAIAKTVAKLPESASPSDPTLVPGDALGVVATSIFVRSLYDTRERVPAPFVDIRLLPVLKNSCLSSVLGINQGGR
jgi:hypothetical protein